MPDRPARPGRAGRERATRLLRTAVLLAVAPAASPARGQVVTDGTLGAAGAVPKVGSTYRIDATLGQRRGPNLFHSFSRLDVQPGETAQFSSGQTGVTNVLARVTGGQASSINGTLQCTIPDANFYLINPAGVVFGPTAQLDVGGSFAVTTADVIKLADGGRFDAATPASSVLTSAAPAAFGFLSPSPRPVAIQGVEGDPDAACILTVSGGKSLVVVGGGVELNNAVLVAPAGRVDVASVASPGDVRLGPDGLGLDGFGTLGNVLMDDFSSLDVTELDEDDVIVGRAGNVGVHGNEVFMGLGSLAQAVTADEAGGGINVAANTVVITEGSALITGTTGTGAAGAIRVSAAESVTLDFDGQVSTYTEGAGPGGSVDVTAPTVRLDGFDSTETGIFANVFGPGSGGNVTVTASERVELLETAQISTTTAGPGAGGNATVRAPAVRLDGRGALTFTGIGVNTEADSGPVPSPTGPAGAAVVVAKRLQILSGAGITSSSIGDGAGPAGMVHVRASDRLLIDARRFDTTATGINSVSGALVTVNDELQRRNGGPGGTVFIEAGTLLMRNPGALVRANTFGSSDAGRAVVKARTIVIDRGTPGVQGDPGTGIGAQVDRDASGRGGNLSIDAREVTVRNGGRISVGTLGPGPAGSLTVVADAVRLSGGGLIESNSGDAMSPDAGRGGDVTLIAHRSIEADGGSRISGRSERNDAGTVTLLTPGALLLRNSEVTTAADLSGGNIVIDPEFVVLNNSRILANARLRSGGNITIQAQNYLPSVGSLVDASSEESTPGAINIDARVVDIAGSIAALESELADTRSLLLDACGMRVGAAASTFVVTGRGGMPAEPGGWSSDLHDLLGIPLREAPVRPSRPGGAAPRR